MIGFYTKNRNYSDISHIKKDLSKTELLRLHIEGHRSRDPRFTNLFPNLQKRNLNIHRKRFTFRDKTEF